MTRFKYNTRRLLSCALDAFEIELLQCIPPN